MKKALSALVGTAGHIDHGKTAVVKQLTGIDCDRFAEEKKRGITIDIGFAELRGETDVCISIVDVPGHKKFIGNMLAGTGSIDILLLVISADDSVMPQTKEHLAIAELVGINQGVIAVTKIDLVDDETLQMALAEIAELVNNSSITFSSPVLCSAKTGEGIEELRKDIFNLARKISRTTQESFFRMPVDRTFSIKGHGHVVTGSVVSGRTGKEDPLMLCRDGICNKIRVRSIERHNAGVSDGHAGSRLALNLTGSDHKSAGRGAVICHPAIARSYRFAFVSLQVHPLAKAELKHTGRYSFHLYTFRGSVDLRLFDAKKIDDNKKYFALIRLDNETQMIHGDRFVLRDIGRSGTIGGGEIIMPLNKRLSKKGAAKLADLFHDATDKTESIKKLIDYFYGGIPLADLTALFNITPGSIEKEIKKRFAVGSFVFEKQKYLYSKKENEKIEKSIVAFVEKYHQEHQTHIGPAKALVAELLTKAGVGQGLWWIERSVEKGIVEKSGAHLLMPGRMANLKDIDLGTIENILSIFEKARFTILELHKVSKLADLRKTEFGKVVKLLKERGELISLTPKIVVHHKNLELAKKILLENLSKNGMLDTASFRDLLDGAGRKMALEILEYFDRLFITKRIDNKGRRVLL